MKFVRHKDSQDMLERWEFLERSYDGGDEYREGDYLVQHERESDQAFKRRVKQSMFVNFCAPIIDVYNGYLYRPEHTRSFGLLENNKLFVNFKRDVDYEGHSYDSYIEQLSLRASVFGYVGVIVDKPATDAPTTLDEQIKADNRPYLIYYEPEAVYDWTHELVNGRKTLTRLVLLMDSPAANVTMYKVWLRDSWEVWSQEDDGEPLMVGSDINPIGVIPFVVFANNSPLGEDPSSDIKDIADINRRIYYIDSDAMEIIEGTAFPMLEEPVRQGTIDEGDKQIGVGSLVQRDTSDSIGHRWIEPPHSSLPNLLNWRREYIANIREIAKIQDPSAQSKQAQSGESLKVRLRALTTVLNHKATSREQAERMVLKLWAKWEDIDDSDIDVDYNKDFDEVDIEKEINMAISARAAVPSKTFALEVAKGIASKVLGDIPDDVEMKIADELGTPIGVMNDV